MAMPLLLFALGSYPERLLFKELLSVATILAFCMLTGQFFWTPSNRYIAIPKTAIKRLTVLHKAVAIVSITILISHPFLLVMPSYYENRIAPNEAFIIIVTTFTSKGIVLGIIAWVLMILLGLLALFRKRVPLRYITWRTTHRVLAVLFIIPATWHAIDLGRHANISMSILFIIFAGGGVLMHVTQNSYKNIRNNSNEIH